MPFIVDTLDSALKPLGPKLKMHVYILYVGKVEIGFATH